MHQQHSENALEEKKNVNDIERSAIKVEHYTKMLVYTPTVFI